MNLANTSIRAAGLLTGLLLAALLVLAFRVDATPPSSTPPPVMAEERR